MFSSLTRNPRYYALLLLPALSMAIWTNVICSVTPAEILSTPNLLYAGIGFLSTLLIAIVFYFLASRFGTETDDIHKVVVRSLLPLTVLSLAGLKFFISKGNIETQYFLGTYLGYFLLTFALGASLAYFAYNIKLCNIFPQKHTTITLLLVILSISIYITYIHYQKHLALETGYDLSGYEQTIWSCMNDVPYNIGVGIGSPGIEWDKINVNPDNYSTFLSFHFPPLLIVLSPFYELFGGTIFLFFIQAFILCLGALPIFWLSKKYLKNIDASWCTAFAYLLSLPVAYLHFCDFHLDTFATTFLIFVFYFWSEKKYIKTTLFIILALFSKEPVALVVIMMGIYFFFIEKQRISGLVVFIATSFYFILVVYVIIPYFSGYKGNAFFPVLYGHLGQTPGEAVVFIIKHPVEIAKLIFKTDKIIHIVLLLMPFAFLSLRRPLILLIPLPIFGLNLLAASPALYKIFFQYQAFIIPFVIISAVMGIESFVKSISEGKLFWRRVTFNPERSLRALSALILTFSVTLLYCLGPSPQRHADPADIKAMSLIKSLPKDASVMASFTFLPHLVQRKHAYSSFMTDVISIEDVAQRAEYACYDLRFTYLHEKSLKAVALSGLYKVETNESGTLIFRRGTSVPEEECMKIFNARPLSSVDGEPQEITLRSASVDEPDIKQGDGVVFFITWHLPKKYSMPSKIDFYINNQYGKFHLGEIDFGYKIFSDCKIPGSHEIAVCYPLTIRPSLPPGKYSVSVQINSGKDKPENTPFNVGEINILNR